MNMPNENVVNRIRSLLAMAEHDGSNEHEASLALEKAQALLLEHNLDRASVAISGTTPADDRIGKVDIDQSTGFAWRSQLMHVIAKNNLCRLISSPYSKQMHIFGTQTNVRAVLDMYYWVGNQLEEMATRGLIEYKRQNGHDHGRTWKSSFYYGAVATINARLSKPIEEFSRGSGRELVLVNNGNLKDAVGRIYSRLGHTKRTVRYGDGYRSGSQAGHNVSLARAAGLNGGPRALNAGV
jgi:hypothetical protein